jgi:hypothetical protein
MEVTFAHLGSMHFFCEATAQTARIPHVVPPETRQRTLILGVFHSNKYGLWMGPLRTQFRGVDLPRKSCSTPGFAWGGGNNVRGSSFWETIRRWPAGGSLRTLSATNKWHSAWRIEHREEKHKF